MMLIDLLVVRWRCSVMELSKNDDGVEYMVDDYFDPGDFEEVEFGGNFQQKHKEDCEEEDDAHEKTDTSAVAYRNGKDIQGIPWERLNHSREKYREMRLKHYKNYENFPRSKNEHRKDCQMMETGHTFFDFQFNTRLVKSTIVHFQLRNLVWATSKHDVYTVQNYSVMHWSSLLKTGRELLNTAGLLLPTKHCGSVGNLRTRVQISTMAVRENLVVAGGFQGELICKCLNKRGAIFSTKLTPDDSAITNSVDIYRTSGGSLRVSAANNDGYVRIFDTENFTCLGQLSFSWSVNNTSVSPDGKLLAILGDSTEFLLADAQSGKVVGSIGGHLDYSFASAWHPDGHVLATGSQDRTCRLWDIRRLVESVAVLEGRIGAIRGIKFSADGRFIAMAEPADFVHIHDLSAGFCKSQQIDLFGEIAGLSFSPDSEALFVGIADRTYGGLLEFRRTRPYHYLDSLM
ncbi:Guanine nucleotide-binding protein subunit beta [Platanthera guangdongensis]|uniref:Guanine nucleotide-binding protein subunit beta n=1 Tax=Platanthera guangdongensis TaxID=2320717 RepID=A0ABR2N5T7_9ASPA